MASFDFLVGTFNTPSLYTLRFTPPSSSSSETSNKSESALQILTRHAAAGSHSWLALNEDKTNLYATSWTSPPTVAAYNIESPTSVRALNTVTTKSRSGYVAFHGTHVYSAGGPSGEVFPVDPATGAFTSPDESGQLKATQVLDFLIHDEHQRDNGSVMDFGGLRHGAHSADLSADKKFLFVADIGRNCVWTFKINHERLREFDSDVNAPGRHYLSLVEAYISPRKNDGPRHCWPHPNGKYLYVLQEHTCMVDVLAIDGSTGVLQHVQGVRIIPSNQKSSDFWADEVRTSLSNGKSPKYLYASTRGLKEGKKGYVAVYKLNKNGLIDGAKVLLADEEIRDIENSYDSADEDDDLYDEEEDSDAGNKSTEEEYEDDEDDDFSDDEADQAQVDETDQGGLVCMYETPTSGGWANAIQPGPTVNGVEYMAMTDSEVGYVFVLGWNGKKIEEVGRVNLNDQKGPDDGKDTVGAATAVWL